MPSKMSSGFRFGFVALPFLSLALASCTQMQPLANIPTAAQAATPEPATPRTPMPALVENPAQTAPDGTPLPAAIAAGVTPGPALATLLGDAPTRLSRALVAFRLSCPLVTTRPEPSGLTQPDDWKTACAAAANWPDSDAGGFFTRYFEADQVGDGKAFVTGYFEPQIAGCLKPRRGCETPIYARPEDLVTVDLGRFSQALKGKTVRGKVGENGRLERYENRAQITNGALKGRAKVIGYAADPVALFFVEIQGSGQVVLPDKQVLAIGYAAQNGWDYTGIGKIMKERGLVPKGTMQELVAWLHTHPEKGRAIMDENQSYIFFHKLTGPGPLGMLGVPITTETTVAVDPNYVPYGAPVLLSLDRAEPNGIWVAQDRGGAIKGSNRFDSFWGPGVRAAAIAGGMASHGSAFVLLPKGSYDRLATRYGWSATQP